MSLHYRQRVRLLTATLLLMTISLVSHAKEPDYQSISQSYLQRAQQEFTPTDYCNGDVACEQEVTHPSTTRFYSKTTSAVGQADHDDDLTQAGQSAADSQGVSAAVTWRQHQPKETIDLTSPSMLAIADYTKNAATLSRGISDKYHDCKGGVSYTYPISTQTCLRPTAQTVSCTLSQTVKSYTIKRKTVTLSGRMVHSGSHSGRVTYHAPDKQFTLTSITVHAKHARPRQHFGRRFSVTPPWTRPLYMTLNGQYLGRAHGGTFAQSRHISNGALTINYATCHGCGHHNIHMERGGVFKITITYTQRIPVFEMKNSCPKSVTTRLTKTGAHCSQGAATKHIGDVDVHKSCWQTTEEYQSSEQNHCTAMPHSALDEAHRAVGDVDCIPTGTQCAQSIAGVCISEEVTYQCTTKIKSKTPLTCGDPSTIECTGGSEDKTNPHCQRPVVTSPVSMTDAMLKLSIQKAMLNEFDAKKLRFFTGKPMSCNNGAFGTFNCCNDSGWLERIGGHQCDTESKDLIIAKRKHLAIKVGTYCAHKVLGVCTRKKESYCVYTSKMGQITRKASISQLHKGLGSAKHPRCGGFTEAEFTQIDFSHIDFSSMLGDLTPASLPTFSEQDIKASQQQGNHSESRCDINTYPYSEHPEFIKRDCP